MAVRHGCAVVTVGRRGDHEVVARVGPSLRKVDVADVAEEGIKKVGQDVLDTFSEIRKKLGK